MLARAEIRAVWPAALLLALRMFGLFVALPILAAEARLLSGGDDAFLIGLAVGAYGLTQAALQAPFGRFADVAGRRLAIAVGLSIFAAGCALAAVAADIWTLIIARLIQGAGVISPAALAIAADAVAPERRARAMALMGCAIGGSFALAIVAAAPLAAAFGLAGIFAVAAALALAGFIPLSLLPPSSPPAAVALAADVSSSDKGEDSIGGKTSRSSSAAPSSNDRPPSTSPALRGGSKGGDCGEEVKPPSFAALARDLWPIMTGGFILHYTLAAVFFAAPLLLAEQTPLAAQGRLYLAAFAASVPPAAVGIWAADKPKWRGAVRVIAVMLLAAAALVFGIGGNYGLGLWLFFGGFNILEAALPAQASRMAPANGRGAALGMFATGQFAGAFCGGAASGLLFAFGGGGAVFAALFLLLCGWIAVLLRFAR